MFADTDGAPIEPLLDASLKPHVVVESSPEKYHVYWFVSDLSLDEFTEIQKAIAKRFGTDPKVSDLSRVLRVPGFYHLKKKPFLVCVHTENRQAPYTADEIRKAFLETLDTNQKQDERIKAYEKEKVHDGERGNFLTSLAGKYLCQGLNSE